MTRKLRSQHLGEIGEAKVISLCVEAGWTADQTRSDFGEDIQFQSFYKTRRDPFRIYAQIKSFSKSPLRIRVKIAHLRNWQMMMDVVILFVFTEETNSFHIFLPNLLLDPIRVFETSRKHLSIKLEQFLPIKKRSDLDALSWMIRYEHLARAYSYATSMAHSCRTDRANDSQAAISYSYLQAKLASEILLWVGLTSDGSPFHLNDTTEVRWLREYLVRISRGSISPGLFGNSFLEEMQTWLAFQLHQQSIPRYDHIMIFEQAARWLCALIIDNARKNRIDVSKIEAIDIPYKH